MTGWLPPRWPNFSFSMEAPAALLIIWWPRQMPKTGTLPKSFSTWVYVPSTASGSPGPFDRNTPSGRAASTSSAGVSQGTTVRSQPERTRLCRMDFFAPQS